MSDAKIAFVGGGNMTRAIVGGMLANGFAAHRLAVAEPMEKQRQSLASELPNVAIDAGNQSTVTNADAVVLAVKPQVMQAVCCDLRATCSRTRPLIMSIAAGVRSTDIDDWLGGNHAVVRVMPNQPALVRRGATALFANETTSREQADMAQEIMSSVGLVVRVENEADIDAVTAVSGSGPAYFYLLIEMLTDIGQELGLTATVSQALALQTAVGAATLARDSGETPSTLTERVRSPGGTTAAALDSLENDNVRAIFKRALVAARDRAVELADQS